VAGLLGAALVAPTGGQAAAAVPASAPAADDRPNVLVVLVDDLSWADLGTARTSGGRASSDFNETPHLARMAREGTVFPNAYATPSCSPTRMALLTGLSAPRPENNVYAVKSIDRGSNPEPLQGPRQGRPDGATVLSAGVTTVAEVARSAGYATGFVGKFHVTRTADMITRAHGFGDNYGGTFAERPIRYHASGGRFGRAVGPNMTQFAHRYTREYVERNVAPYSQGVPQRDLDALVGTPKHITDAVADAAVRVVDDAGRRPFFALVSPWAVHAPTDASQARLDLRRKYGAKRPGRDPHQKGYAGLVEGVDQAVGRLLEHLRTTPDPRHPAETLAQNTVVVVTSDNGGHEGYGAHNGPLRGMKASVDEGGLRVPFLAWSGEESLVRPGASNPSVIDPTDLMPTVADYAGARPPRRATLDGSSLRRAFARGARLERPRFVHFPGYVIDRYRQQRPESLVRSGRWKLRYRYETQQWRLYDLATDLGERRDLSRTRPRVRKELGRRLLRWLEDVDAPLARVKPGRSFTVRVAPGTRTYANGRVTRWRSARSVRVGAGEELPVVLR